MSKTHFIPIAAAIAAFALAPQAKAQTALDANNVVWDYVGSFQVDQGPYWGDNPPVYSGITAAELIFGPLPAGGVYATSLDQDFVTHTAILDGWGEHDGLIASEDYDFETGNGYDGDPGFGSAYSAYVSDGAFEFTANGGSDTIFVFDRVVAVPDAGSTLGLLSLAFGSLTFLRRRAGS